MSVSRSGCSRPGSVPFAPRSGSCRPGSASPGPRSRYPYPGLGGSGRGWDDSDRGLDRPGIGWKGLALAAGRAGRERRDPGTARGAAARGRKEDQESVADRPPGCISFQRAHAPSCWTVIGRGVLTVYGGAGPNVGSRRTSALDVSAGGSVEEVSGRASDRALQLFDN
jgi:hypothetical protein